MSHVRHIAGARRAPLRRCLPRRCVVFRGVGGVSRAYPAAHPFPKAFPDGFAKSPICRFHGEGAPKGRMRSPAAALRASIAAEARGGACHRDGPNNTFALLRALCKTCASRNVPATFQTQKDRPRVFRPRVFPKGRMRSPAAALRASIAAEARGAACHRDGPNNTFALLRALCKTCASRNVPAPFQTQKDRPRVFRVPAGTSRRHFKHKRTVPMCSRGRGASAMAESTPATVALRFHADLPLC